MPGDTLLGMELKSVTRTMQVVDYRDLENFIQQVLHIDYDIVSSEDYTNLPTSVDGKLSEYEQIQVDKILLGKNVYASLGYLMNHLAKEGLIPTGEYLIEISR